MQRMTSSTSLLTLELRSQDIDNAGAAALALYTNITSLDLAYNNVRDEGAKALVLNSTLTSLGLACNKVGAEGAKALSLSTTLTSLDLYFNKVGDEGAKALALNSNLTALNLAFNNVGVEGTKALALNSNLTSLDLSFNNVGDEGAKALALNSTLRSLGLVGNNVGDAGAHALNQNTNLIKLEIGRGSISPTIYSEHEATIKRNIAIYKRKIAIQRHNLLSFLVMLAIGRESAKYVANANWLTIPCDLMVKIINNIHIGAEIINADSLVRTVFSNSQSLLKWKTSNDKLQLIKRNGLFKLKIVEAEPLKNEASTTNTPATKKRRKE